MVDYYQRFDPEYLVKLETETPVEFFSRQRKSSNKYIKKQNNSTENTGDEFQCKYGQQQKYRDSNGD